METKTIISPAPKKSAKSIPYLTFGPKGEPILDGQMMSGVVGYSLNVSPHDSPRLNIEILVRL